MDSNRWNKDFQIDPEDRLFSKKNTLFSVPSLKKYGLISAGSLAGIGILWAFFSSPSVSDHELPRIKAPEGPIKVKPSTSEEETNKATSSHRLIYEKLGARNPNEKVEHLLKEPEEPLMPPPTLPEGFMESFIEDEQEEKGSVETSQTVPEADKVFVSDEEDLETAVSSQVQPQKQRTFSNIDTSIEPVDKSESENSTPPITVTGSVVKKTTPPSVSQEKKIYWIQLASLKTREATEREWKRLTSLGKLKPLLGGMKPTFGSVDMGRKEGIQYRLRIGPFSQDIAKKLSSKLKAHKVDCMVKKG